MGQISYLKEELKRGSLENEYIRDQVLEFQVEVARILPEILKDKPHNQENYPLRGLASVVAQNPVNLNLEKQLGRKNFEEAKSFFNKKDYKKAVLKFKSFIDVTPYSVHLPEAYFLLSESYFQVEDFENSLLVVEKMIELFPSSELTGYAMIRMGKIYEYQNRPEEAVEIYQIVLRSFPDRGIASQAMNSLDGVEL